MKNGERGEICFIVESNFLENNDRNINLKKHNFYFSADKVVGFCGIPAKEIEISYIFRK